MANSIKKIVFVTGNSNKLKEVQQILGDNFAYKIDSEEYDVPEYQGEEEYIVTKKCESAFNRFKCPVLVEDTSLLIDCLQGLPGPYVKWFLDKIGPEGLYKMTAGYTNKKAIIRCLLGFQDSESGKCHIFKGEIEGILVQPRGTNGFGFDRCFQPAGYEQTLAELGQEVKDQISHRYRALKLFGDYIHNCK